MMLPLAFYKIDFLVIELLIYLITDNLLFLKVRNMAIGFYFLLHVGRVEWQ